MHFTSTSTCMNILSQFYFLTPMNTHYIVHGLKWKFSCLWRQTKRSKIFKIRVATPNKFSRQPLLAWIIHVDNILSQFYFFYLHGLYIVHNPKGKFDHFWRQPQKNKIFATKETMPTKIALHAFDSNLYLHEYFEPTLIFDPHGCKGCGWVRFITSTVVNQQCVYIHWWTFDVWLHKYINYELFAIPSAPSTFKETSCTEKRWR